VDVEEKSRLHLCRCAHAGLGIGATSAIFSVVDCVLLKPLPYSHPDELVSLRFTAKGLGSSIQVTPISPSHYFIFRERSRTFQDIGLYNLITVSVTGPGEPERAPALGVTDSLFPILGVTPSLGRSFTQEDDSPNSADTVILTHGYWSRKLGGDPSVIGRTIEVDGKPHTIIGVLPESFRFLDQTSLAMVLPIKLNPEKTYLGYLNYVGVARLKAGVTLEAANADVAGLLPIVDTLFPPVPGHRGFEGFKLGANIRPLKQEVVGDVSNILWVLLGGISLVLVIACANLANFFWSGPKVAGKSWLSASRWGRAEAASPRSYCWRV
jgi:putative ABC transport system permease protein